MYYQKFKMWSVKYQMVFHLYFPVRYIPKRKLFFVYIRKKNHISDVQCSHVYLFCTGYRKTRFQQEKQLKTKLNENSIINPTYNVTIFDFLRQNFTQEQNTFTEIYFITRNLFFVKCVKIRKIVVLFL